MSETDPTAPSVAEHVEAELLPRTAASDRRRKPPGGKTIPQSEVQRRLETVEALMVSGMSRRQLERAVKQTFSMSIRTLDDYCARVRKRWATEDEESRPHRKAEQVRRLQADLFRMRTKKDGATPWREIHMHEDLIAKMHGHTRAGVAIQVNNTTVNGVPPGWAALTEEQLAYMAINGGALPPGVTEDHLISPPPAPAAPATSPPADSKATP